MEFCRYQHIKRFGNEEVKDIELGECYVFPKLDGTNASVWLDKHGTLQAGSRNRVLSESSDNQGFYKFIAAQENIQQYLKENPTHRLYGEFLVPHSLRTYEDDAWRKFYVFDVCVDSPDGKELIYIPYEDYKSLLEKYDIEYIPCISKVTNGNEDYFSEILNKNNFLIKDGAGRGEGIVIKNYAYKNQFNQLKWAKIVTAEFKVKNLKTFGPPCSTLTPVEFMIAEKYVTESLVEKERVKIEGEVGIWSKKQIPMLLGRVFYCIITEEMWQIVKDFKSPTINFSTLRAFVTQQTKKVCPNLFADRGCN